jgi:hypothetical protein
MSQPPSDIEAAFESFADYLNAVTATVIEPLPDAFDDSDDFITPVVAVPSIRPPHPSATPRR